MEPVRFIVMWRRRVSRHRITATIVVNATTNDVTASSVSDTLCAGFGIKRTLHRRNRAVGRLQERFRADTSDGYNFSLATGWISYTLHQMVLEIFLGPILKSHFGAPVCAGIALRGSRR
jgi:hypothetical protein